MKTYKEAAAALNRLVMHNIPGMTVKQHHLLCIGVLGECYKQVDPELKKAISEALDAAKEMGVKIHPELVTETNDTRRKL